MTEQLPYEQLLSALRATGIPFAEDAWSVAPRGQNYGVISIEMQFDSQWGDNHMDAQGIEGSVDLYATDAGIIDARKIQTVLNTTEGVSWHLNSRQYEEDTRLTHWEWIWRVIGL